MVFLSGLAGPSLKVRRENNPLRVPPSSHEAHPPPLRDGVPSVLGFQGATARNRKRSLSGSTATSLNPAAVRRSGKPRGSTGLWTSKT